MTEKSSEAPGLGLPARGACAALVLLTFVLHFFFITYGTASVLTDPEEKQLACAAAYDSLGDRLLQGRADIDPGILSDEAIYLRGKQFMYFNPFPALLRAPLNGLFPGSYGRWNRLGCLAADAILLVFFALLLSAALRRNPGLAPLRKAAVFLISFTGLALGSPVVLLMSCSYIYHESILWAFAWSVGALYFLFEFIEKPRFARAVGLSACAAAALLSKVTFGLPWILIVVALVAREAARREPGGKRLIPALAVPLVAALLSQAWYNVARFESPFLFFDAAAYQPDFEPFHEFIRRAGMFNFRRIPSALHNYFAMWGPYFSSIAPWVRMVLAETDPALHPDYHREQVIPLLFTAPWILLGAFAGAAEIVRGKLRGPLRFLWAAFIPQWVLILSVYFITQRYTMEFFPLLLYLYVIFLASSRGSARGMIAALAGLCAFSVMTSVLSAVSWNIEFNWAIPPWHRDALTGVFLNG